jgi:hypothetical protein
LRSRDNVDAVIGRMCELTPKDSEHHLSRGQDVADLLSTIELRYTRLMDEAEARKQAQQSAAAAAATAAAAGAAALGGGPGGAAHQPNRVREAIGLKPECLAHDAGHVRLRDWLQQFRRYYNASHFDDGNDDQNTATSLRASMLSFALTSSRWSPTMPLSFSRRTSTTRHP